MPGQINPLLADRPHRRFNALTGEWVFVSPHRTQRPWQGRVESRVPAVRSDYDPQCYLCPGNARANGERNPQYTATHVFTNDFPAFLPDGQGMDVSSSPLLRAHLQGGTCRVMCYSARHDLTLAQMFTMEIRGIVDIWAEQITELGQQWRWVQVFENQGELMGCSNPHPHGQIWAGDFIPSEPSKELARQQQWFQVNRTSLLVDYAALESSVGERLVLQNAHWLVVVPWWAVWPFETLLLPRRAVARLPELTAIERDALADILSRLLQGYDQLFETSFPYSFGWHGAPMGSGKAGENYHAWQLHAHFYPPLLRSATVKKFMVGYELLAEAQRDLTPEQAAERLRRSVNASRSS
jgi:UDPglucose--hexose-1-phosphate uridylyltransferase